MAGTMTERPLGVQISAMLRDRGVEVIFGIPGVHNQELYRGIEEAGLRHILARHEQGAGFMADGYARASGRPGVCYVISGPGLTNIMTPMGQAQSDSVPMLVISSCLDPARLGLGRGRLHEMKDQAGAAAAVCDWSLEAVDAAHAFHLIDRALREFTMLRGGVKHVQVPIAALEGLAPSAPAARTTPPGPAAPGTMPDAALIRVARRPLFILGGGAVRATGLTPLFARMGAAVFETMAGRGIVGHDYPLHFGAMLARSEAEAIIGSADLVIAVGTELAEVDLWRETLGHRVPLIRVDIDPAVLNGADTGIAVHGDAARFFDALSGLLDPAHEAATGWDPAQVRAQRARWQAELAVEYPGILPICAALQAALPADTMIYSDMTQFAYAALEAWPMARPGHWHHPYGFGTLGYGLPAAIGGAIARPGLPTIAIAGDYGFQYTVQELATAVELGLSLPVILWDNGKLGAIEASMVRAQIAPNAVIQRNPDFVALAKAYGAAAAAPRSLGDLKTVVQAALSAGRPTLIHVTPATAQA